MPDHILQVDDRVRWIGPEIDLKYAKTGKVVEIEHRSIKVQWDDGWLGWARPEYLEHVSKPQPVTLIYNREDGFAWVRIPDNEWSGDLSPHYFATLPEAVKRARELGYDPTHWCGPNDTVLLPLAIARKP